MDFYYDITIKSNTISVTRIEMTPSSATLEIGETIQLSATAYPTNATNRSLHWTTENYSVASVSNSGLVTARGVGRVWIWARNDFDALSNDGYEGLCTIDGNIVTEPLYWEVLPLTKYTHLCRYKDAAAGVIVNSKGEIVNYENS